MMVVMIEMCCH